MEKELLELVIVVLTGSVAALFSINYFFKGSVLLKITTLWYVTLFIFYTFGKLREIMPDIIKAWFTTPLSILAVMLIFRHVAINIQKPLKESIANLKKLSEGELNLSVDNSFQKRKDELGSLSSGVEVLRGKLVEIIGDV